MRTSTIQAVEFSPVYAHRDKMPRQIVKPEDAPELALLKEYLRWRVRRWTTETPMGHEPRQQRDFARESGLSPGTVSGIIRGAPFSEAAVNGILRVLKLTWPDGFREADKWRLSGKGRDTGPSKALLDAVEEHEERTGEKVNAKAMDVLAATERRTGPMSKKEWLAEIPGVMTVVKHFPERVDGLLAHGDRADHELARATKPRPPRGAGRKSDER